MKKIILGLALLGSLAFGETQFQSLRKQYEQKCKAGNLEACGDAGAFYKLPTKFGGGTHPIGTIKKCFIITKKLATETIMLLARIWEQCILAAKE